MSEANPNRGTQEEVTQTPPCDELALGGGVGPPLAARDVTTWEQAEASCRDRVTLEAPVTGFNRGGLLVDLGGLQGFVPASELVNFPRRVGAEGLPHALANYIGARLSLQVIEVNRRRQRLVLTERLARVGNLAVRSLLEAIEPGQIRQGRVDHLTDYGAFVDLGGVQGLLHISEMSWQHIRHPHDVCTPGSEIEVYVIEVNRARRHVKLSLKRLQSDPWSLVTQHYHVGDIFDAVITGVASFGAFARLPDGIKGLIHVSEMVEGAALGPGEGVQKGQQVKVRILRIDPHRQRMSLSLRL